MSAPGPLEVVVELSRIGIPAGQVREWMGLPRGELGGIPPRTALRLPGGADRVLALAQADVAELERISADRECS